MGSESREDMRVTRVYYTGGREWNTKDSGDYPQIFKIEKLCSNVVK
jgi:hypothetical protein